ncbi:recombinase family protein [Brotolimicola acetigignens]|uniref:recombinase family protein n=1 Tax=Waltera acetigignens TaxID=2981769 RepID=UPI002ED4E4D1
MEEINIYGYMRVSSKEQNEDRQKIALTEMGVPENNIYMDKQSGKDFERTQYKRLLRKLNENSVLYIKSIDRLGRNYGELNEQWRIITKEKKADIVVIDMPLLDTRREKNLLGTFISDVVLALLSYVAENERTNIKQRQAEGIAAAKARGVKFGRPPLPIPENFYQMHKDWRAGKITIEEAAKACNMCPKTFYSKAVKYEKSKLNSSCVLTEMVYISSNRIHKTILTYCITKSVEIQ